MTRIPKLLALLAVVAASAAGGAAVAQGDAQAKRGKARAFQVRALEASAQYLGLTRAELRRDLPGHSLAQLAIARGKSVDGLEAAIASVFKAQLDRAQSAGTITSAQAAQRLTSLQQRVDRFVQRVFGEHVAALRATAPLKRVALREAAEFLGLTPEALRTQLRGTSLAAVAAAQGKSSAALQAAMLEPFEMRLDRAQASGRITAAQAQERLTKLRQRIATLVAKTFGS